MAASEQPPATPVHTRQPPSDPDTPVLMIGGRIARADVPRLCDLVHVLLENSDADLLVCDVGALVDPDVVAVDALARIQLTARRSGRRVELRHACGELRGLLALMGLCDVMPLCEGLGLEPRWQSEEREQAGRVEKETDADDLSG